MKTIAEDAAPELPLGWTSVRRNSREAKSTNAVGVDDYCCNDPSCSRKFSNREQLLSEDADKSWNSDHINNGPISVLEGSVVLCLPDVNPSWFQGYLQLSGFSKPWGLLAEQEELDECLQCADGGYRRVSITLFTFSKEKDEKSIVMKHVEWTGGDMVCLLGDRMKLKPDRVWTGQKAVPFLERYFGSLVQEIRGLSDDTESDVLELIPNVAVVTGRINVRLEETSLCHPGEKPILINW